MTFLRLVSIGVIGCVVGCFGTPERVDDGAAAGTAAQALAGDCDVSGCGTSNSPEIDHLGVHDLELTGAFVNANGFRIKSFSKNGTQYRPVVDKATLTGRDLNTGVIVLQGGVPGPNSLLGARFVVFNDRLQREYVIQIDQVDHTKYWAKPGGVEFFSPTYLVTWTISQDGDPTAGGLWKNICSAPPSDDAPGGMNRFHVVLFEGDRIDAKAVIVSGVDKRWFNIGCAMHALAKQHLDGHTQGALNTSPLLATALDERTAHLKMLAADYCGAGKPMTMAGEPLTWKDHRSWMAYQAISPMLEARWSRDGAICLNAPRLATTSVPDAAVYFPNIERAIADACVAAGRARPPACPGPLDQFLGAHLLSANP